jgi:hypothetical protein
VDIPIVPFDESACTRPSKLPATREIALLLDAYDIDPTYIHRGRKTERGCRVEHFVEASNSRACKRAQQARSAREAVKIAHGCTVQGPDQGQSQIGLDSEHAAAGEAEHRQVKCLRANGGRCRISSVACHRGGAIGELE